MVAVVGGGSPMPSFEIVNENRMSMSNIQILKNWENLCEIRMYFKSEILVSSNYQSFGNELYFKSEKFWNYNVTKVEIKCLKLEFKVFFDK